MTSKTVGTLAPENCPFCSSSDTAQGWEYQTRVYVFCRRCGARGPWVMGDEIGAISSWNTRSPVETSARDILQRLVDTCELATGAPWPALDEARAFLSGSPEEPTAPITVATLHATTGMVQIGPERSPSKASASHVHVWEKRGDFGGASCKCGTRADGWYCPDSPDHLCHYEKGNLDQCDFCGLPEERK